MIDQTPHVAIELPADSTAPSSARRAIADAIGKGALPHELVEDARLIVSELATNAVMYGAPPQQLRVWTEPGRIRVEVADASPRSDRFFGPTDSVGGFGLQIVAALASAWGIEFHPDDDGKIVWFEMRPRLPASAGHPRESDPR